jgi:hypothetical protein
LVINHYIPGYKGLVPGMKSENPISKNTSRLSIEMAQNKDYSRFTGSDFYNDNYKMYYILILVGNGILYLSQ